MTNHHDIWSDLRDDVRLEAFLIGLTAMVDRHSDIDRRSDLVVFSTCCREDRHCGLLYVLKAAARQNLKSPILLISRYGVRKHKVLESRNELLG